jgi:tRNA A-37 threonylcarbamoyl transferase component Bud32
MSLVAGTRLGPYEILAPLGAGGMGEVYRARDTRLGRDVAVKVLPQHLSTNSEIRQRFEREAKTVSNLNHPNICTLHDVGREGDIDYLVMELVDGETLAARLGKGALSTIEVLRLGAQIADALDRAHRAGIAHRDLKPGNIMLTKSGAKLLDFGLARATGLAGADGGRDLTGTALALSPTVAAPLTAEGTLIGTFLYMAPEQLEGREADARTDIWALGCVLYEAATGRRPFEGRSQASLISSIMSAEPPPISRSVTMSPPALDELVRTCLAKDPDERWQSAGDLRRELQRLQNAPSGGTPTVSTAVTARAPRRTILIAALATGAALASLAWWALAPRPQRPTAAVLELTTAPGGRLGPEPADVAISPDGRWLAYVATDSTKANHLAVRALDSPNARVIPGTDRADHPFWSPDSRWIAYFTTGEGASLMKVPLAEGQPVKLYDIQWSRGGTWGKHGDILFSPTPTSPIQRIHENGGPATAATTPRREPARDLPPPPIVPG